jgi:hypothetical protein
MRRNLATRPSSLPNIGPQALQKRPSLPEWGCEKRLISEKRSPSDDGPITHLTAQNHCNLLRARCLSGRRLVSQVRPCVALSADESATSRKFCAACGRPQAKVLRRHRPQSTYCPG